MLFPGLIKPVILNF